MRVLAIDFGTSNTVAAVSVDGAAPRLLTIDGSPLVPSSIYLAEDGTIAVGRDADRQARIDPSRYEPNPKRRIDDGEMLLGSDVIPVRQAIAAVLKRVLQEFQLQFDGAKPDVVRLTHPARWRKTRRDVLVAACREAGLSDDPILVPEPVGAATHFVTQGGHNMQPGQALAVYDLGGGTFDVAIVQKTDNGFEVTAEAGLPDLGGLDFDHAILEHVGKSQETVNPEEWARLNRPTDTASRRAQRALAVDIKEGKEALSRHPHTDIAFPAPFHDVHITRSEFEELIRPNLARSVELLSTTISDANLTADKLAGVYLVGGSSRVPLVARLIQEGLGVTPATLDQPEATVASGALYLNVGNQRGARPDQNATPVIPQLGAPQSPPRGPAGNQPGRPGMPGPRPVPGPGGSGMGDATRRVTPGELPQIRTVRPQAPTGNIRRIPQPGQLGPQRSPGGGAHPAARPMSGPMAAPSTGPTLRPSPTTGPQQRPAPRSPASGPISQPNNPRPSTGAQQRPPTGSISRPATGPIARPAQPAAQPARPPAPPHSSPPASQPQQTNWQPLIWAAIGVTAVILLIILFTNL
ncbi:Hsp70 family protein [Blastococcus sp. Marseille-P5729]|uniref:Hsp70 family protein n=1 Tax=Blastococcus sp. Marseille-P5729 TaxID=2086582 RepID=UPI001F1E27F4|nr:Hsp70 family protein [Blastococcus sp. Marseille-P5729]